MSHIYTTRKGATSTLTKYYFLCDEYNTLDAIPSESFANALRSKDIFAVEVVQVPLKIYLMAVSTKK
ncbi:hypothetical protein [Crinalium epipsammum]|uniref:hypothetical protein n=1 Tax=Crinalium epipsammum TaxID=241425 RepID=UPI0012FB1F9D|nr:hypothetical protein [Crinalium epipsammum]